MKNTYKNVRDFVQCKMEELFCEIILNFGIQNDDKKEPEFPIKLQDPFEDGCNTITEVMMDYIKHNKKK